MIKKEVTNFMKNINKSILLLLVVIFCFVGCNIYDPPLTDSSSSSSSDTNNSIEETSSAPDGSTEESSSSDNGISNDYVNVENFEYKDFTEDDLWLQSYLKENYPMASFLLRTLRDTFSEPEYKSNPDAEHKSQYILQYEGNETPYLIVPNTYFNNYEEYQALRDKYYSSDISKVRRVYADIVDTENGRIILRDYSESYYPQLIEINGRLYHVPCCMGSGFPPCFDMAKVITRTDDEIVFSYLCYIDNFGNAQAGKGVLKKENGVWKFGWDNISEPIEFLDIHKVWGV